MAFVLGDRARETSTAPGTGSFTVNGAVQGAQSLASVLTSNGDTSWYCATNGTAWETGLLTRTSATVFARTTIYASSNAGAAVNFSSGTVDVFIDLPASKAKALINTITPQGRLTLQTVVPVMITTQSAKTTIYYTSYNGNVIPIYDGTNMVPTVFSELSVLTTDTTKSPAAIGASKVNDWFIWSDAGTLRIGHGPDWTSDTARSAGTALTMVNGILLNNASITNGPAASRGTYVGTTRSNGSSQLDWIFGATGTAGWFGVWNAYNRADVRGTSAINAGSWTYNSATVRESNNSSTARTSFVTGLAEDAILASHSQTIQTAGTLASQVNMGIQLDATNSFLKRGAAYTPAAAVLIGSPGVVVTVDPQLGFHFIAPVESTDTTTCTLYGQAFQSVTVSLRA